jgi:glycosyltransferase involved in cell wall biosynthesis
MSPELSVVLPCYRAAPLAAESVGRLEQFLSMSDLSWEVIVVDDGGGDFGDEWATEGQVRLVRLPVNRGKGAAVRAGMRAARGDVRVFTDVDLPYDLSLLLVIARYITERRFHVVIGDRTLPGASYAADIGWKRRIASGVFSLFVGKIATGGFFDTQCGLKGFRGDIADHVFALGRLERFAFDVELVYISLVHRLDIKRIPVQLRRNDTSSVRLLRDSIQGFIDVFRIKGYQLRGAYDSESLDRIVSADFAQALDHVPVTAMADRVARGRAAR